MIVRRDYKRMNLLKFMRIVASELKKVKENGMNEMANEAINVIVKCLDIVAPKKTILIRKEWQGKSWFNEDIHDQMQFRDMAYKTARINKCNND